MVCDDTTTNLATPGQPHQNLIETEAEVTREKQSQNLANQIQTPIEIGGEGKSPNDIAGDVVNAIGSPMQLTKLPEVPQKNNFSLLSTEELAQRVDISEKPFGCNREDSTNGEPSQK